MTTLAQAIAALSSGELVAFPTETVYGLGADASNPDAVARIFEAKGRPPSRPITVHLGPNSDPAAWAIWTDQAQALADRFWPGPLTLVLPKVPTVADIVTAGGDTVGLRVPAHPLSIALLDGFGGGVAAPSANRSGTLSPTTAQHVRDSLGDRVRWVLDGGPCSVGLESTVLSLVGIPTVLRQGAISAEDLSNALGTPVISGGKPTVPSISAKCFLQSRASCEHRADTVQTPVLWCGPSPHQRPDDWELPNDVTGYAKGLYQVLHQVAAGELWIERVPDEPDWGPIAARLALLTSEPDDASQ